MSAPRHLLFSALLACLASGCASRVDLGGSTPAEASTDDDRAASPEGASDASDDDAEAGPLESQDVVEAASFAPEGGDAATGAVADAGQEASPSADAQGDCNDGVQDGAETGIDCGGGVCPACSLGAGCLLDADCASQGCDAVSRTCVYSACYDQWLDGDETALDCGGGTCDGCATGQACALDRDCASGACDALSLTCVLNACTDHRQDGDESDVDCGGFCPGCPAGDICNASTDCQSGRTCRTGLPHVCI